MPPRIHSLPYKKSSLEYRIFPLELWVKSTPDTTSNNTGCCHCYLLSTRTWQLDPIAKDIIYFGLRTWRNQGFTHQEASSLLPRSQRTRRCSAGSWDKKKKKREIHQQSHPAVNPVIHHNDQHDKICPEEEKDFSLQINNGMNVAGITDCSLSAFKSCFQEENTCLVLQIWPRTHGWEAHRFQLLLFC